MATMNIVKKLVATYCNAPKKSMLRLQTLSNLSSDVTLDQLNNNYFKDTGELS
jgi:hypothetical protein